jgi:hypothetical protein
MLVDRILDTLLYVVVEIKNIQCKTPINFNYIPQASFRLPL